MYLAALCPASTALPRACGSASGRLRDLGSDHPAPGGDQVPACRPQRFAEFKHGFVQWLASFIVIAAVFSRFEAILFRCRALDTYCTFDVRSTGFS